MIVCSKMSGQEEQKTTDSGSLVTGRLLDFEAEAQATGRLLDFEAEAQNLEGETENRQETEVQLPSDAGTKQNVQDVDVAPPIVTQITENEEEAEKEVAEEKEEEKDEDEQADSGTKQYVPELDESPPIVTQIAENEEAGKEVAKEKEEITENEVTEKEVAEEKKEKDEEEQAEELEEAPPIVTQITENEEAGQEEEPVDAVNEGMEDNPIVQGMTEEKEEENDDPMEVDSVHPSPNSPPKTPSTKDGMDKTKAPRTPKSPKSPSKRLHYEPVDCKLHAIRKFAYSQQDMQARIPKKRQTKDKKAGGQTKDNKAAPNDDQDPWGDFSDYKDEVPSTPDVEGIQPSYYDNSNVRYPIRVQSDQWALLAVNPKCWLDGDHISFYTWWSQRTTSPYNDKASYFPIYFPAGQQSAIYSWFQQDTGISEAPSDIVKLIQYIWRVIHPTSYFLTIKTQFKNTEFAPEQMDRWYQQYASKFKDVPMEFNIFSKRVISLVVGNGIHWCSYFAFHLGEKLCQPVATTRSGKQRPRSFITYVDSLGNHEIGAPEDLFVVFLFDVILQLEKWITRLVNRTDGDPFPPPGLIQIARECRQRAKEGQSIFRAEEFEKHNSYYQQSDDFNCGIFSLINVTAVYVADTKFSQNWLEIRDPADFFTKVLKPYFDVAKGGKKLTKELAQRAHWFRYNYIRLMASVAPSKHYMVGADQDSGSYALYLKLRGGKKGNQVLKNNVADMLQLVQSTGSAIADADKKKEETAAKAAADKAAKAAADQVSADKAADATDKAADGDKKKDDAAATPAAASQSQGTNEESKNEESPTSKSLRIKAKLKKAVTERQKSLFHDHQERARKELEYDDRMAEILQNKRKRQAWLLEGKEWEQETVEKLEGVTKELSLGPSKDVLEQLEALENLMMQETTHSDDEDKALATLDNCFPITEETGETEDQEVSEIAFLKYIPTHQKGNTIFRHVYQGRSGSVSDVVDLINPNWVRWCFEPNFCYYVMRIGLRQWKHCKGNRAKMTWIPVPVGAARVGGGVDRLMIQRVPLKYRQFEEETCAFMALASALHYCASELNMGDKQAASALASGAFGYAKGKNARDQLQVLARKVKEKSSYFRKYELRVKRNKVDEWDILNIRSPWPTVVVLLGGDGGQSHSVTLVGDLVFDSNCTHAMRLTRETLDWCCNYKTGFMRAAYALRFWN